MCVCRVTGQDAARWWARYEAETYDRVLVDAPCTSERHVIQQAVANGQGIAARDWSAAGCKEMASLQVKLLVAALKVGPTSFWLACQK